MRFVKYEVRRDLCRGCGDCEQACPKGAIVVDEYGIAVIDQGLCDACGDCSRACRLRGIVKKAGLFR